MTTAMQVAMANAQRAQTMSVPVPATRRVWQWLKDKGGAYTCLEIATALKMKPNTVSATLYELHYRDMLRREEYTRRVEPKTAFEWRALGNTYVLLPRKKAKKVQRAVAPVPVAAPDAVTPTAIDVEAMSVRDARELYRKLHDMFGGAK